MTGQHIPVLLKEVIDYLNPQPNQNFIDLTVGGGGHAAAILEKTSPRGQLIGIDWDKEALVLAENTLKKFEKRFFPYQANFKQISKIQNELPQIFPISGILLDLGLSSFALGNESRGFSFQTDGPLDMRFDPSSDNMTAAEVLNTYSLKELEQIFKEYGEDKFYKNLAAKVIQCRVKQKFKNTHELVSAVLQVYRDKLKTKKEIPFLRGGIHPATRVFQALRLAVNNELNNLREVLPQCLDLLLPGGRLAVISFHSLEDRIVKHYFRQEAKDCLCPPDVMFCQCRHHKKLNILTKKPVRPTGEEIVSNPRSRSALLRVAVKI